MILDRTRAALSRVVTEARRLLTSDAADGLRRLGLQDDGALVPIAALRGLSEQDLAASVELRELLEHYVAQEAGDTDRISRQAAYARLVREIGFTTLNRLVAIRMSEERGLIQESVRSGLNSAGFQLFERIAGGGLGDRSQCYRVYLECLYDELAVDLPALFSRSGPEAYVFPSATTLEAVLEVLADQALSQVWNEDEAIGWVYQFYNDPTERKKMREAHAPRNSRELAVRNQFFTPRYVVEFLTDNTLGRLWYEMRQGDTFLADRARYLLRQRGETPSGDSDVSETDPRTAMLAVTHRERKDPRDIKILDPACGSGHFLLYAYDLLECMYEEAWADGRSPRSIATGATLREDYPAIDRLRRDLPTLILRHNLYGVDIDARAAQIAGLALWLRAQQSYQRLSLKPAERPSLRRGNIVVAEPMPGETDLLEQFVARLDPPLLAGLVRLVFETMQLADEAGVLLKVEQQLRDAIQRAKSMWSRGPRLHQLALLPDAIRERAEQLTLELDVSGISDEAFWAGIEERVFTELDRFASEAINGEGTRKRLFAEDATDGFAFVDLSRQRFDVILMNPPFGEFSKRFASTARGVYPRTNNDIFAAFTERALELLLPVGHVGIISSRTGFFLSSFASWREDVIFGDAEIVCLADLGSGVMDDATVEAAAYCLETSVTQRVNPIVFRTLGLKNRAEALEHSIAELNNGRTNQLVFRPDLNQFGSLPGSPFVYWVTDSILRKLATAPRFEPTIASVRQGLATGDNPRFVRAFWEVSPSDMRLAEVNTSVGSLSDSRRWAYLVMTGDSQPWFSPIFLTINWMENGRELRAFVRKWGSPSRLIKSEKFYFRPGLSWTRRAVRLIPYAIPRGCIPTASRYMAFPEVNDMFTSLAVLGSNVSSAYSRFYGGDFERPNHLVETIKAIPWPNLSNDTRDLLQDFVENEYKNRRRSYQNYEPFLEFTAPRICHMSLSVDDTLDFDRRSLLRKDLEALIAESLAIDSEDESMLNRDLQEAVAFAMKNADTREDENEEPSISDSHGGWQSEFLSYAFGVVVGRWDVRFGIDHTLVPQLPGPFDPLPACPLGTLVGPDGLPANSGGIASEEWLRARPDAITMPPPGLVANPTIDDDDYPLRITWSGILVDEPGHSDDVVRRVREALAVLGKDRAGAMEEDACAVLGVRSLEEYFRRPTLFFADHLARYTQGGRQAPIYLPLSTSSGLYTLWIYYPKLTSDTLYTAANQYVQPRLARSEREITELRAQLEIATGREATRLRERSEQELALQGELLRLRDELLRIAALPYRPSLDDGVIISAAPLHTLFRLPKWASSTRAAWAKLERGDYDWAHLAHAIWPDRVRQKCRADHSLAIAHDLEALYVAPPSTPVRRRGRRAKVTAGSEDEEP